MRIIFMGSDELACPALERIVQCGEDEIVAVVTQPDRAQGRNRRVEACSAKITAERLALHVFSPEKLGAPSAVDRVARLKPDIFVVAAYGQYISAKVLGLPRYGAINIHPSLLPKYRGASPIQWAVANGEEKTGVTILYVSEEMDAGDIICQQEVAIGDEDTTATLKPRLAGIGATLVVKTLHAVREGCVTRVPQDEATATYVHKLKKEDGMIDWTLPAVTIRNRVRGFNPWPGCYCEITTSSKPHRLKILKVGVESGGGTPGEVLEIQGKGPLLATGEGTLRLLEMQPEGKRPMSGMAYLCGHPFAVGDRFFR